jgi:predicted Fe-S protein YdhL (DUF1289 family)
LAIYPKIQSPCPYAGNLAAIMDGDMCRACKRQVFDLTAMSDDERVAFVRGCKDEVCVTYRFPVRPLIAAAAIAAAMAVAPTVAAACDASTVETVVETGGIKDPAHVAFVQNPGDAAIPELPVVYEAKPAPNGMAAKQPIAGPNHKA